MGAGFARIGGTGAASGPVLTPVATVSPVISGVQEVGNLLSCTTGTWTNSPSSYAYQWYRGAAPIGGATSATYLLAAPDDLSLVSCRVTATNAFGDGIAFSNALLIGLVPSISVAPVISGTPTVGSALSATTGTWSNSPTSYAYQWKRNGSAISGATSSGYVLVGADTGAAIVCTVAATNVIGTAAPVNSNTITVDGVAVNSVAPVVSGTPEVGETLSCSTGTWSFSPTAYSYQWKNGGTNIAGATTNSYLILPEDDGDTLSCAVTATNPQGVSAPATSNALLVGAGGDEYVPSFDFSDARNSQYLSLTGA